MKQDNLEIHVLEKGPEKYKAIFGSNIQYLIGGNRLDCMYCITSSTRVVDL